MFKLLARVGIDGFLLGLIVMVGLAWLLPDFGKSGGYLAMDAITGYGVALVFLLYGLTLPPERMKAGLVNWRLHLLVQISTFGLFPVLAWGAALAFGGKIDPDLMLGFFFLAALPSTISSSVAMTSIARGNVAGAIFNATLSSLLGVVLTPLWVNWYLSSSGASLDLGRVLLKIVLLVLLPIILGQVLRPWVRGWIEHNTKWLKSLDRIIILLIVFNSFSDSVAEGVWAGHGGGFVAQAVGGAAVLFAFVFILLRLTCRALGFNREDLIAGVFCGTKKSLATGVPMAKIMFGASPALGLIIAPTILYHLIQLVAAGIIARRWQDEA
ncbi:bile acid:sodium symporter family protein [Paramagnetospirillum magneticum]|uniref:Predicted Na+-dependent transporter n=1 Tax=Paramagnetospirillum magneticum (strain ATCC 700264 / AMB-1) TaxID=342108 RepID=Q2W6R0_PARM1|nr:bile acid:sodium symporter family protein [Paramagnetospirillum magneticum]BAE50465.1 Predicted Na+-dependent transporter [Paramagnetospirillum magneticum AMB-1]